MSKNRLHLYSATTILMMIGILNVYAMTPHNVGTNATIVIKATPEEGGDTIVIGEGQPTTLYSSIGFNTNGGMTQKSITDELVFAEQIDLMDSINTKTVNGQIISDSTCKWINANNMTVLLVKVTPGRRLYLVPHSDTSLSYCLMYDNSSVVGDDGAFADGYTTPVTISAGSERFIDIPSNGNYLYMMTNANGTDQTPFVCAYFETLKGKISDVGAMATNSSEAYSTLIDRMATIEENLENVTIDPIEEIYEGWDYVGNWYLNKSNTKVSNSSYAYTNYIPIMSLSDDDRFTASPLIQSQASTPTYYGGYYYDADKRFISGRFIIGPECDIYKRDMPEEAAYVRLNYTNKVYPTVKFIRSGKKRIDNLEAKLNATNSKQITITDFTNKQNIKSADGTTTTNNNFSVTNFIDIKGATAVHSSQSDLRTVGNPYGQETSQVAAIAFYDINKTFISAAHAKYAECPADATFIRCTVPVASTETVITIYGISSNNQLEMLSDDISKVSSTVQTGLAGKKVAFIGDSMTYGTAGGGVTTNNVYHKVFADLMGCTNINLGANGSTIASGTGRSTFASRATQANLADVDMVVIFGGTNDFTYDKKAIGPLFIEESIESKEHIGDKRLVAPTDTETFAGALHNLIVTVRSIVGEKPIVLMTPLNRGRYTDSSYPTSATSVRPSTRDCNPNGDYLMDFVNAIKEIGRFYGIPVFDAGGIVNFDPTDRSSSNYTGDLLHPNYKLHLRLGTLLYKWVCQNIYLNE